MDGRPSAVGAGRLLILRCGVLRCAAWASRPKVFALSAVMA